jgi:7,8-dihydropterin-6-yl-methyl-4-(beta-D-ribofuranosyl)aminobenzene 5'-phosphate synthase
MAMTRAAHAFPGRDPAEQSTTSKGATAGPGFKMVTRELERTTEFEQGFPGHQAHRHGGWEPDPLILDEQALVASVRGHGLLAVTG